MLMQTRGRYHDANDAAGCQAGGMRGSLRVSIDFEMRGDPIAGTISSEGVQQPFTGWLGLMSGLQRAVDGQTAPNSVAVGNREDDA